MFCIYCGKKCPDIAKFCPSCGKEQLESEDGKMPSEEKQHTIDDNKDNQIQNDSPKFKYNKDNQLSVSNIVSSNNANIKPIACVTSIISLIVEAIIIFLTFTDIFKINIGNGYYSSEIEIGLFDLLDAGSNISRIMQNMGESDSGLVFYAMSCLICVVVCIIYFFYNLFSYSFHNNRHSIWGKNYSHYSIVPAIIFIGVSLFGVILFSTIDEYINAVPNAPLIGIYILTGIQSVTNIIYDSSY